MKCICGGNMVMFKNDTPNDSGWGGYRLYGCIKCGRVYYEHIDMDKKVKKMLEKNKKTKVKRVPIPKPIFDSYHHHDNHLIN